MKCRKCGSENMAVMPNKKNPSATDLYCKDCGAWQKFATKDEIRLYSNKNSSNNMNIEIINPSLKTYENNIYKMTGQEILQKLGYKKDNLIDLYKTQAKVRKNNKEASCFMLHIFNDRIDKNMARYEVKDDGKINTLKVIDITKSDLTFAEIIAVYKIIKEKGCIIDF